MQSLSFRPIQPMSRLRLSALGLAAMLAPASLLANAVHSEAVSGDFSGNPDSPTPVTFSVGDNEVTGTTGNTASVVDRDFFTFTVPADSRLVSITMLQGTTSAGPGNKSFIGIIAGNSFGATIPAGPAGAATLLGYHHYEPSEVGTDILDDIGVGLSFAPPIGFTGPLSAGTYSAWIQETVADSSVSYGFNFRVASVPDSGPGIWASLGLVGLLAFRQRQAR